MTSRAPGSFLQGRKGRKRRDALAAYLFLLPAFCIIVIFGLWPVVYSLYVSLHRWNIRPRGSQCFGYWLAQLGLGPASAVERTDCLGLDNYVVLLGVQDRSAVIKMVLGLIAGWLAYRLWRALDQVEEEARKGHKLRAVAGTVISAFFLFWSLPGLVASGEWTYLVSVGLVLLAWVVWKRASDTQPAARMALRFVGASALLSGAAVFFFVDLGRMWELGNQAFLRSLMRTVFYSMGTVPVQLSVSLVLAYVLFQDIKGRGFFRLVYFLPYIAPTVATAVVFKRIFSLRDSGLMNRAIGVLGLPPLAWLQEGRAIGPVFVELANKSLGTQWMWPELEGLLGFLVSGPSLALVSIMIYNWWVYIGYSTVIYLAGLGSIPHDLYEAASIDGANRWTTLFRITIPLLSPTIFFLAIMATIGTFKAFNSIWVMYEPASRDAVDTASILVFRTFRSNGQFGEATAMAFILLGVILALSSLQRRVGERLVFYG